ncbi:MAG TPA: DMT family transporter [Solirubrobacteraceae bacterium]|jgi:drug/metabolite transporter (DMT)-like permease|nr:DMT family transporter [Solirubrobacteraceae bacterium]
MTVLLALLASGFIGISDFLGGAASRTHSPLQVTVVLHVATLATLVPIAIVLGASDLTPQDVALGAASGLATGVAYVGFFAAIGRGRIGIVVPVSAAMTALLPTVVGIAGGNALSTLTAVGVLCALVSIPLIAYEAGEDEASPEDWTVARQIAVSILCGVGFGAFFVCIGHTSQGAGLWPTVGNLAVAATVTGAIALARGVIPSSGSIPRLAVAGGIALGAADATLTTALQRGPLTVASVLGNLYPLVTIALGVALLGERIRRWQGAGIALAVSGVAMIAAG